MTSTIDMAHTVSSAPFTARLSGLLAAWVPEQRWFGGKGRRIESVGIRSCLTVVELGSGARLLHVLVDVMFDAADGGGATGSEREQPQTYQVFVGVRERLPHHLRHAAIGEPDRPLPEIGGVCYDALHDAELTAWLLERIVQRDTVGPLRFDRLTGYVLDTDERSLVLTGEQSNTSLVYGDKYIAKVFRRPAPGRNPELELGLALAVAGSPHIAPPIGWAEFDPSNTDVDVDLDVNTGGVSEIRPSVDRSARADTDTDTTQTLGSSMPASTVTSGFGPGPASGSGSGSGFGPGSVEPAAHEPITLLTLQPYLPSATDGWVLALTSVRDLFAAEPDISAARAGADFAPEAHRLGQATARVHQALAATLPTGWLEPKETAELAQSMKRQLEVTARRVPALRAYAPELGEALDQLGTLAGPLPVQRVHGDYHLGQAMRTTAGWILLDFEGEPARPLAERRTPASPLKDIAGMLRSFDYAAHHLLANMLPLSDDPAGATELTRVRAVEWAARNRDAFCRGYAEVTGYDPRAEAAVLRAFEIDKAVYEVGYEAANRPTWLAIPLAACARLAAR